MLSVRGSTSHKVNNLQVRQTHDASRDLLSLIPITLYARLTGARGRTALDMQGREALSKDCAMLAKSRSFDTVRGGSVDKLSQYRQPM